MECNDEEELEENMIKLSKSLEVLSETNLMKREMLEKIQILILKGIKEKWLINEGELTISSNPFAKGSYSCIYDCIWRGTDIALKVPLETNTDTLLLALKEVEIWSSIRHPNLVQFLGATIIEGKLCILMEKINGYNLREYITKFKLIKKRKENSLEICKNLIQTIYFLHNCNPNIIYRDLKPENIMIYQQDSEKINVKLTDFGLSRFMPEDSEFVMTGNTGTMRYIAPEVFKKKKYNLKSDIYSLGWVIYYIVCGRIPFSDENMNSMAKLLLNEEEMLCAMKEQINYIEEARLRGLIRNCVQYEHDLRLDIKELYEDFKVMVENDTKKSKNASNLWDKIGIKLKTHKTR